MPPLSGSVKYSDIYCYKITENSWEKPKSNNFCKSLETLATDQKLKVDDQIYLWTESVDTELFRTRLNGTETTGLNFLGLDHLWLN